jgi:hypothetical protein
VITATARAITPGYVLICFFSAVVFYGQRRYTPPSNFQTLSLFGLSGDTTREKETRPLWALLISCKQNWQ